MPDRFEKVREKFPVTANRVYLNNAAVAPVPPFISDEAKKILDGYSTHGGDLEGAERGDGIGSGEDRQSGQQQRGQDGEETRGAGAARGVGESARAGRCSRGTSPSSASPDDTATFSR